MAFNPKTRWYSKYPVPVDRCIGFFVPELSGWCWVFSAIRNAHRYIELTILFHGNGAMDETKTQGFFEVIPSLKLAATASENPWVLKMKVTLGVGLCWRSTLACFFGCIYWCHFWLKIQVNYLGTRWWNMKIHTFLQVLMHLKRCWKKYEKKSLTISGMFWLGGYPNI